MQKPLQHICHLLLGGVSVAGDSHLDFHRRIFVYRHIARECCGYGYALCVHDLDHCLRVLVNKLRLNRQTGRVVLVDQLLNKEELLLQACVLVVEFVYIECAELANLGFLSYGVQDCIAHIQRTRVDAEDTMFVYEFVLHLTSPAF